MRIIRPCQTPARLDPRIWKCPRPSVRHWQNWRIASPLNPPTRAAFPNASEVRRSLAGWHGYCPGSRIIAPLLTVSAINNPQSPINNSLGQSAPPSILAISRASRIGKYFAAKTSPIAWGGGLIWGPEPKDPVLEFLEDIKAGHCEYFASAGTLLLLRSVRIPAQRLRDRIPVRGEPEPRQVPAPSPATQRCPCLGRILRQGPGLGDLRSHST